MATHIIDPRRPATATAFSQLVTLEGVVYRLRLRWSPRNEGWYLDVELADPNEPLLQGVRCVLHRPLWLGSTDRRLPPGELYFLTLDPDDRADPGFDDLGRRVWLVYEDAATIPAPTPDPQGPVKIVKVNP